MLVDLGFPSDPLLWYTGLGILSSVVGVVALRVVEARIDGIGVARRTYALACLAGVLGLIVGGFALALLAQPAGISVTLIASGVLIAFAGAIVARSRGDRAPTLMLPDAPSRSG